MYEWWCLPSSDICDTKLHRLCNRSVMTKNNIVKDVYSQAKISGMPDDQARLVTPSSHTVGLFRGLMSNINN